MARHRMAPSRRRLVGVVSMATVFFVAWLAGPVLLPFSDLTLMHVTVGLVGTYGIGGLALGLAHRRAVVEVDHRQRHVPQPERRRRTEGVSR
jgi:hypothetical protein